MSGLQTYARNFNPDGLGYVAGMHLKKPSWEFNFLQIFTIFSSSIQEKHSQMLERLFEIFLHSINILYCFFTLVYVSLDNLSWFCQQYVQP
jgi:hypothetical protein